MRNPKPNQIYRHFKGNLYKIITTATHTETGEKMIVYQALYGEFQDFVRPLAMFLEEVDREKYPEITQKYRFELVARAAGEVPEDEEEEKEILQKEASENHIAKNDTSASEASAKEDYDKEIVKEEIVKAEEETEEEEFHLDPLLEAYLDTSDCKEKLNILDSMKDRITDDMITTMALVMDFEIPEGDLLERLQALRACLAMREKYEGTRLRS